tara:strand:- start:3246 stop:3653 length:408 start_codon:yes stop_codon:yes gene_type:complete
MPFVVQAKITDIDITDNPLVFYVYPENLDKTGGSEFTTRLRKNADQCLPLVIKQKGFKTKDSFWLDSDFDFARKHFVDTQDRIKVLMNKHEATVVFSLDNLYTEIDEILKYSPLFHKFYIDQIEFMRDRWKPRAV